MAAHKYYKWEKNEYLDLYNIGLDIEESHSIFRKLCRHFTIGRPTLLISSRFDNIRGMAYGNTVVKVGKRTNLGTLAHEVAHLVNCTDGGRHHDRKFKRWNKKVVTYVRARDYFGLLDRLLGVTE